MSEPYLILIVEDEELHRKLITKVIGTLGHTAIEAADGRIAVELAGQRQPDLILMDIHLPEMDGLTATRLLKANPVTAAIPVIALTALAMVDDQKKIVEAGCDDYIIKPILVAAFSEKLNDWLRKVGQARGE